MNKLNKVPQITLYFWIIKVLCTTGLDGGVDLVSYLCVGK